MGEVAAGVTDLLLAAVLAGCTAWLWRAPGVHRYWALMLSTAAAGALAGAAHHLVFAGSRRSSDLSWIVGACSSRSRSRTCWPRPRRSCSTGGLRGCSIGLRIAGLVAYLSRWSWPESAGPRRSWSARA